MENPDFVPFDPQSDLSDDSDFEEEDQEADK
jgi:hypothetical protein